MPLIVNCCRKTQHVLSDDDLPMDMGEFVKILGAYKCAECGETKNMKMGEYVPPPPKVWPWTQFMKGGAEAGGNDGDFYDDDMELIYDHSGGSVNSPHIYASMIKDKPDIAFALAAWIFCGTKYSPISPDSMAGKRMIKIAQEAADNAKR